MLRPGFRLFCKSWGHLLMPLSNCKCNTTPRADEHLKQLPWFSTHICSLNIYMFTIKLAPCKCLSTPHAHIISNFLTFFIHYPHAQTKLLRITLLLKNPFVVLPCKIRVCMSRARTINTLKKRLFDFNENKGLVIKSK